MKYTDRCKYLCKVLRNPKGYGCTPIPLTANCPVPGFLQPVCKSERQSKLANTGVPDSKFLKYNMFLLSQVCANPQFNMKASTEAFLQSVYEGFYKPIAPLAGAEVRHRMEEGVKVLGMLRCEWKGRSV